jgi:hypothetical protein
MLLVKLGVMSENGGSILLSRLEWKPAWMSDLPCSRQPRIMLTRIDERWPSFRYRSEISQVIVLSSYHSGSESGFRRARPINDMIEGTRNELRRPQSTDRGTLSLDPFP